MNNLDLRFGINEASGEKGSSNTIHSTRVKGLVKLTILVQKSVFMMVNLSKGHAFIVVMATKTTTTMSTMAKRDWL